MAEEESTKVTVLKAALTWFSSASPLRKIQDLMVVAIALMLAGIAYTAYQSKEAIVHYVTHASENRRLDVDVAIEELPGLFKKLKGLGAVAVALYSIDLRANTIEVISVEADDHLLADVMRATGVRQTFVSAALRDHEDALVATAALMSGDPISVVMPLIEQHRDIGLYEHRAIIVPLPDANGRLLCGALTIMWPHETGITLTTAPGATARLLAMEYAAKVSP